MRVYSKDSADIYENTLFLSPDPQDKIPSGPCLGETSQFLTKTLKLGVHNQMFFIQDLLGSLDTKSVANHVI